MPDSTREWYTDERGITRSRSIKKRLFWEKFWDRYMIVNLFVIAGYLGILIWTAFDLHERLPYAMFAQVPPLLMMAIRRIFK